MIPGDAESAEGRTEDFGWMEVSVSDGGGDGGDGGAVMDVARGNNTVTLYFIGPFILDLLYISNLQVLNCSFLGHFANKSWLICGFICVS